MLREIIREKAPLLRVQLGRYERENVHLLQSLVTEGMTVWDVGANIGQMTYVLSKLTGPEGRVVAIEPGQKNARDLRRLMGRKASVIEAAVSDHEGHASFANDGSSAARISDAGDTLVRLTTLDALLDICPKPHLVKMDIEGHELPAFRGATRLLQEVRPVLCVEFHGTGLPERDIDTEARELVGSCGYSWRPTPGGWHVAEPSR